MARRISQSSVNWASLAERVPPNQKVSFTAFKARSDKYLRSVLANPESAPKIDWAYYQKHVPIAGLVDSFKSKYEALKVPYPADTVTAQIDAQEKQVKSDIQQFKDASEKRIAEYKAQIKHLQSLLPYDQMTMEDYRDAFPEEALDPINRPTFWPHTKEEQIGYKAKEGAISEH